MLIGISPLERATAWVKECMSKLVGLEPTLAPQTALACALDAWNDREVVRGNSPRQHALLRAPDPSKETSRTCPRNPDLEVHQQQRIRTEAEVAFSRWQAQWGRPTIPAPEDPKYARVTSCTTGGASCAAGVPIQTSTTVGCWASQDSGSGNPKGWRPSVPAAWHGWSVTTGS